MKSTELLESLKLVLKANLVPFIQGSPGVGKSDIVKQLASQYKLKLIDLRLSQCDATDLSGFPKINDNKAEFIPLSTFPLQGETPDPEYPNGWLLFLDEINSAPRALQASAYKLILDRMVGNHHLSNKCYIVSAGNKATDGAIVTELSTALKSRLVTLTLEPDLDTWLEWAEQNKIDYRVLGFIRFKGLDALYNFNPQTDDKTYPCPRTWAMLSKVISNIPDSLEPYMELCEGIIGKLSTEFVTFCNFSSEIPTYEDICKGKARVPKSVGGMYLITSALISKAKEITDTDAPKVVKYLDSLGKEYAVLFYISALKRNFKLSAIKEVQDKLQEYGTWLRK